MTADLIYIRHASAADTLTEEHGAPRNLALLVGFGHWLYGYIWDSLRKATFRTTTMYGLLNDAESGLNQLCDYAGAVQASLSLQACGGTCAVISGVFDGSDYGSRAVAFSLREALRQQNEAVCRWAQGVSDGALDNDAKDRLTLLNALSNEVLTGLRLVASRLGVADSQDVAAAVKAAEALCQASLPLLWAIGCAEKLADGGLDALIDDLDAAVERDSVEDAGPLAEKAMHGIWMRLHDEISAIERRQLTLLSANYQKDQAKA